MNLHSFDPSRRFDRQTRFAPLGRDGQARLERASVLVLGCGALGGHAAQSLVRSGIGRVVLVDRDVVDVTNLPRQVLFDERHARERTLKVAAAAETLARVGGPTRIETHARHVDAESIEEIARGVDLVLDGTDNLATRYLVNDWCVERACPWIYAGVVGSGGLVLPIVPGQSACLRCVFRDPPPALDLPTCETAGVLQPAVALVAALQAGLALRVLGGPPLERFALLDVDAWDGRVRELTVERDPDCPCCAKRDFEFLDAGGAGRTTVLCGRNTVQIRSASGALDLDTLAARLPESARDVVRNAALLSFTIDTERFTVFADGRALVEGTSDPERALALHERYVGS